MLAAQPVDFRKSVHTLSALVSEALRADPYLDRDLCWSSEMRFRSSKIAAPTTR
jgi:hypothetical protein